MRREAAWENREGKIQNRVTDHRIGLTVHQLDRVIDGKLDEFVEALTAYYQAEKLK